MLKGIRESVSILIELTVPGLLLGMYETWLLKKGTGRTELQRDSALSR